MNKVNKTEQVHIRLTKTDKKRLDYISKVKQESQSDIIRAMINRSYYQIRDIKKNE